MRRSLRIKRSSESLHGQIDRRSSTLAGMSTINLPQPFISRMQTLLGEEVGAFVASYAFPSTAGLRVNTGKIPEDAFRQLVQWELDPIPWSPAGFRILGEDRPGRHPFHAAGLYYLQEPSAMAVAEALDVQPGDLVLDLAASPGGKATHIASLLRGTGTLIANEIIGSRIKPLGENLERWGVPNTILLNEEPGRLADRLGPVFDRVLLDAPCSGEGMFRKSPIAIREWSPEHVAGSADRQAKILVEAARLVRPGGHLLYSTCTFAPEENEQQIARFLDLHPEWELVRIPLRPGFTPARHDWSGSDHPLERAVRIWPHVAHGEGHFLALLRRSGGNDLEVSDVVSERDTNKPVSPVLAAWIRFVEETLNPEAFPVNFTNRSQLVEQKEMLFLAPSASPALHGLRVVRPGLPLGEAKPGRFEPSHALALALRSDEVREVLDLSVAEAKRFLQGEQLRSSGSPGWLLVTVEGFALGWGKRSGDVVKNHYPKGLRRNPE